MHIQGGFDDIFRERKKEKQKTRKLCLRSSKK